MDEGLHVNWLNTQTVSELYRYSYITDDSGNGNFAITSMLLDALFTFNIVLAILLVSTTAKRVDFSVFPTILLVATLTTHFECGLNAYRIIGRS